jgi:cytoskeletal protein RodZ
MFTEKEAWETSHPDKLGTLGTAKIKDLLVTCEWYSKTEKRPGHQKGFQMRAEALERELEHRRHKTTIRTSIAAAIVSLVGAAASWFGAIDSLSHPHSTSVSATPTPQVQQSKTNTQAAQSATKNLPGISATAPTPAKASPTPQATPKVP